MNGVFQVLRGRPQGAPLWALDYPHVLRALQQASKLIGGRGGSVPHEALGPELGAAQRGADVAADTTEGALGFNQKPGAAREARGGADGRALGRKAALVQGLRATRRGVRPRL